MFRPARSAVRASPGEDRIFRSSTRWRRDRFRDPRLHLLMPVVGYGLAWDGHFAFETNTPAAFAEIYSLMGDGVMFAEVVSGRRPFYGRIMSASA